MRKIPSEHPDAVSLLRGALSQGGVVVVPTDTLYGLSTPISSRRGYERVVSIKRRRSERGFVYLAGDIDMVERYIEGWGCASRGTLEEVWPAPLSAVFRSGSRCPQWVGETIAFRIPKSALLAGVIDALGEPILSTSVNETGQPPLEDVGRIEREFGTLVDLIVDGGRLPGGRPSTLVDLTGENPAVVRVGDYVWRGGGKPSK